MKQYKQVILIWAVALVVTIVGLFYMNTSMNAIQVESDDTEPLSASELTTTNDTVVGAYELQSGVDEWNVQPATANIQN